MRIRRRYRAAGLALAGVLVLTGCGGDDSAESENGAGAEGGASGGEITVRGCKPAQPLIPTSTTETCGGNILDQVTAKLVRYNPEDAQPENDIAESIEPNKKNTVYTIKLKRGIKFHDGTEVKAKNFIDAWNYGAYGPNAQLTSYFFEPIAGYKDVQSEDPDGDGPQEAPDPEAETMSGLEEVSEYEFTVTLASPSSTFPQRLGYTAFSPLPDSFFEDDGEAFGKNPIGAGPFKFVSGDPNREFVLEADPTYNRAGKPKIEKVTFKVFRDENAAYREIIANQLDITDTLPSSALIDKLYETDLEGRNVTRPQGVIQLIAFPPEETDDSFNDPKLKQAISLAIDRQQVIDIAFPERTPATGWVSPVVDGYKAGACGEFCEFNPDRAKQLFEEAGGYEGTMTLSYNADSDHKTWTEATCTSIKNTLGVDCVAKPFPDFATFRNLIEDREMEGMFRSGWQMDYPSIENFLVPLYATNASSNDGEYSNPEFDAQLKKAAAETSPEAVNAAYQEAELMLASDMPAIPLWYPTSVFGHSERVSNVKITAFGTYDLSSVTVQD